MKFIELHDETDTFWLNIDTVETVETETLTTRPQISSFIMLNGFGHYCKETPEEIFEKIAEAEQHEFEKVFVYAIRCKDCKWCKSLCNSDGSTHNHCSWNLITVDDNFYCAHGEERKD